MTASRIRVGFIGVEQLDLLGRSEVAAELYVDDALDGKTFQRYLDIARSVSALPEIEIDPDYCATHKELNGS